MTAPTALAAQKDLRRSADPETARHALRYFKTGLGEYGEGDRFLGVRTPALRQTARRFAALPPGEAAKLLASPWHEDRALALVILVNACLRGGEALRESIARLYLANLDRVNNWDLVDISAPHILGCWMHGKNPAPLDGLARSKNLWHRRVALLSTLYFIRQDDFALTFRYVTWMLDDPEDLLHKACGWMLREIGKRDRAAEEKFLKKNYLKMPRTALRYAIERFEDSQRLAYLHGKI